MSATRSEVRRSTGTKPGSGRLWIVLVLFGSLVLLLMALSDRPVRPFDLESSAPDGYLALRTVLEDNGITARAVMAGDDRLITAGSGTVVFIPRTQWATAGQLSVLTAAANRGATVVYGSVPPSRADLERRGDDQDTDGAEWVGPDDGDSSWLVDLHAERIDTRVCSITELADLGPIAFDLDWVHLPLEDGPGLPSRNGLVRTCYGSDDAAQFVEVDAGAGRIFVLASPYLWTNAMLKQPVDPGTDPSERAHNDMTAWRILSGGPNGPRTSELLVVGTSTAAPLATGEGEDLFGLLPVPFKAFSAVLGVALGVFVWGRARRLGHPVDEQPPVVVESSELTAATGRLLVDDPAFIARGAESLRGRARKDLAVAVGVDRYADPADLCRAVGARSHRDPAEVAALLYGDEPLATIGAVIDLDAGIERLRMEVGDGRSL